MSGSRKPTTMKAAIETMDNGYVLTVREHGKGEATGVIVLKKVFIDFNDLVQELKSTLVVNK